MIRIKTNIGPKMEQLITDLGLSLAGVTRAVALGMAPEVHRRIHVDGKAADGSLISPKGYTAPYLRLRQKKYNRTPDSKVILSLTRQMETDFNAVAGSSGSWGLGFQNSVNFDKAQWNEQKYGKEIYKLTTEEREQATKVAEDHIKNALDALSI